MVLQPICLYKSPSKSWENGLGWLFISCINISYASGRCWNWVGAQVGLIQPNPICQRSGEVVFGSWNYQKLPKNLPTKDIYKISLWLYLSLTLTLSFWLSNSHILCFFSKTKRQRELQKKSSLKVGEKFLYCKTNYENIDNHGYFNTSILWIYWRIFWKKNICRPKIDQN